MPPGQTPGARALHGETVRGAIMGVERPDDGPRSLPVSAAPIRGAGPGVHGAVVTFIDVTDRQEMEQQREDLPRAFSHDLRSPLTAILGHAQLLPRSASLEPAGNRVRATVAIGRRSAASKCFTPAAALPHRWACELA